MLKKLSRSIQRKFFPSDFDNQLTKWFSDDGDYNKRLSYELSEESFVVDLGGYKGQFASDLFSKYQPRIWIFEPIPEYYEILINRFENNSKIQSFNIALGNNNKDELFYLDNDGTSIHNKSNNKNAHQQKVEFRDIKNFFNEHSIETVDLMKVNIEGGEYDLLDYMIEQNIIENIKNIQIQFHTFVPEAEKRMALIQEKLALTHELKWQYKFVWESWSKK